MRLIHTPKALRWWPRPAKPLKSGAESDQRMTAKELASIIQAEIDEIEAESEAWDERYALLNGDDGLTTDQRAAAALEIPERFNGEHDIARAWLKESKTARIWGRK